MQRKLKIKKRRKRKERSGRDLKRHFKGERINEKKGSKLIIETSSAGVVSGAGVVRSAELSSSVNHCQSKLVYVVNLSGGPLIHLLSK